MNIQHITYSDNAQFLKPFQSAKSMIGILDCGEHDLGIAETDTTFLALCLFWLENSEGEIEVPADSKPRTFKKGEKITLFCNEPTVFMVEFK